LIVAACVVLVVAACAGAASSSLPASPSPTPAQPVSLAGRTFLSTAVSVGGKPFELIAGTRVQITFAEADISASAGCNTIGGQYRVQDGRLAFTGGSMTEMGCPDGRDRQDSWLIGILGAHPSVSLGGDTLTLATTDTTITLLDREVALPDQPLAGPTWIIVGLESGDVVSSVPAGVFATVTFDASGAVRLETGCNSGSGRWSVADGQLRITELVMTQKACPAPAGQVETTILEVIQGAGLSYAIDASSMTLRAGAVGLELLVPGPD
jgi:heat shock protein HslJ